MIFLLKTLVEQKLLDTLLLLKLKVVSGALYNNIYKFKFYFGNVGQCYKYR